MADAPPAESARPTAQDFLTYTLNAASHACEALLDDVPELRSVAVVLDWGVPLGAEVMPAVAIARKEGGGHEPAKHPGALYGLVRQADRLTHQLRTRLADTLEQVNRLALTLAVQVNERRSELAALRAETVAAEAELARARSGGVNARGLPDLPPAP